MKFWRWLFYREITQTEARERMKQATKGMTPPRPMAPQKPKTIAQWTRQHGRRTA